MRPNGVLATLVAIAVVAAVPVLAEAAVAPPACWKGKPGCVHTSTPHWNLLTFGGTVSVVGTRNNALTCADVAAGPREEIVAGRYTVKLALDRARSQTRIAANADKLPTTSKPLEIALNVTSTTRERIRTLTPAGDTCTETFRDCEKSDTSTAKDSLDVFVRARRILQETPGDWINNRFLECAETPDMVSLLPTEPMDVKFMSEPSTFRAFRHRGTTVTHGRDRQIGDGATSIEVSGKLTYARTIRACTKYPLTRSRCRTARG
jgi:hypothetical protein